MKRPDTAACPASVFAWTEDCVIALSFSNLLHLRVWIGLVGPTFGQGAFIRVPATPGQVASATIWILLIAAVIFLLLRAVKSNRPWVVLIATGLLMAIGAWTVNGLRTLLAPYVPMLRTAAGGSPGRTIAGVALLLAVAAFLFVRPFRLKVSSYLRTAAIVASPAALLTLGQAGWAIATYSTLRYIDKPLAAALHGANQPATRVVWIVFDELDQALSFDRRPKGLELPELDSLRRRAVYATSAYPPAGSTIPSMVALITGRQVAQTNGDAPDRIEVKFQDGSRTTNWGRHSVFAAARAMGFNTGAVGWHLPYCRVLNDVLSSCWWDEVPSMANSAKGTGLPGGFEDILRANLEGASFGLFGPSLVMERFASLYQASTRRASELAVDSSLGLTLLHLPGAHPPFVYDRKSGQWTRRISLPSGYPDSLALVDRTLGELHRTMAAAGEWDRTTVVVTADHWYRDADTLYGRIDRRVPFLVKLTGQNRPVECASSFNTVVTRGLLLGILQREITTPEAIVSWLDRQSRDRSIGTDSFR
jgi:hypothetical protein